MLAATLLALSAPLPPPGGGAWRPVTLAMATPPARGPVLSIPLPPPQPGLPPPRILGPAGRPLVVLDPGHGGHDPGAVTAQGVREKDVTLAIARAVRDALIAGGRVRVALTRDDDRFLILAERREIARELKADLFVSIHADSAPNLQASGATIYTLSDVASDAGAAAYAARENRVDTVAGVNLGRESAAVSAILLDLAQRETAAKSVRFAELLRREADGLVPFRPDHHRSAGFVVLRAADTPAILFEAGYLTNATDVARLTSAEGQAAIARGMRQAIEVHFARRRNATR